jgi:hypothetical protein
MSGCIMRLKEKEESFKKNVESILTTGSDMSGCEWEFNTKKFIWCETFGFCVCFLPDDSFKEIHKVMRSLNGDEFENKHKLRENPLYAFIMYWLDEKELSEHGGSIPGWLTNYGKTVFKAMDECLNNEI